jgi:hypothetical protein
MLNVWFRSGHGRSYSSQQCPSLAGLRQFQRKSACRTTAIERGRTGPPLAELDDDLDRRLVAAR